MPDKGYRTSHKTRVTKEIEILPIDDDMIVDFLRDLKFYEYVPSLEPLRREVIKLQSRMAKLKSTSRSGHWDALRDGLTPIINRFHHLLSHDGYEQLRVYLKARKRIVAKTLIFSESPY